MKNALRIFAKSTVGAAIGAGIFVIFSSGLQDLESLFWSMLVLGAAFGVLSTVVHSFHAPSFASCLLTGIGTVIGFMAFVFAGSGWYVQLITAYLLAILPALGVLAALLGVGGWLALRK